MQLLHSDSEDNCIKDKSEKQSFGCFSILRENLFLLIGILVAISLCMYGVLGVFGFSAFPDEFGYWAPAAAILGYDWSQITALGSYYSYGYSIILVPFLYFFSSSIGAYRAAIIVNLILQCISFFMLYEILRRLYPNLQKNARAIVTSVAILYPAWVFYNQTTMTESLLNFLIILSVFLMMIFMDNPKVVTGIFLGIVLIYSHFVHMRCLGMIVAGFATLLVWMFGLKKSKTTGGKKYLWLLLLIPVFFVVMFIIKDKVVALLYSETSAEVMSWNDYSGMLSRLGKFFSFSAIKAIFFESCGKLLYLSLASMGIAMFGAYGIFRRFIIFCKKLKEKRLDGRDYLWLYIQLLVFMQFMVALVYLLGASYTDNNRLDLLLHGRYIDFIIPIMTAIGLCEMLMSPRIIPVGIVSLVITIICDFVSYYVIIINEFHKYNVHGFTMIGMSYFATHPMEDPLAYMLKESALQIGLMIGVFAIAYIYRMFNYETFLLVIMIAQVLLGLSASDHYIFTTQTYIYGEIMLGQHLEEVRAKYPDKEVIHIFEGGVQYIELVQFEDKTAKIKVVNGENKKIKIKKYLDENNILILDSTQDYCSKAEEFYNEKWNFGHLTIFYNEE